MTATPYIDEYLSGISALLGYPAPVNEARELMMLGYKVEAAVREIRKERGERKGKK